MGTHPIFESDFDCLTEMRDEGKKRRRSTAIPESSQDLPSEKKIKDEIKEPEEKSVMEEEHTAQTHIPLDVPEPVISETERRKRLREILRLVAQKLRQKDVYGIVHIPPCSLLYPNYDHSKHFDMIMVMKRIDKLCYFNVAQFRQAVSNVVKCQTDFFPSNTVRHEFAFKFEQFSRKLTTYRSLLNLCAQLEIKEELSKKDLRDMLVGSDLTTEIAFIDEEPEKNPTNQPFGLKNKPVDVAITSSSPENSDETFKRRESDNFTTLSIASGAFNEAHINGKPVTIGDLTGKVIGAPMLPRRTRTIEDKAYTISYLHYGSYGPTYDSRSATISKEDSDLLFKTQPMETVPELEQVLKLGEMEEIDYIVNRALGDDKKAQEILDKTVEVEPDPLALLSLEKEGIDVSFLKAFDPSQEIKENIPVDQIMEQLSIILPELAKLQDKRLLSNRPVEYIDNFELKAAELIQKGLHSAIKKVEPAAVASV